MYHKKWSQGHFGFNIHANPSFVSVSLAEEFIGAESKMLCFRLKCIAKFLVFPDLVLTLVKQILQVAVILLALLKPKCL